MSTIEIVPDKQLVRSTVDCVINITTTEETLMESKATQVPPPMPYIMVKPALSGQFETLDLTLRYIWKELKASERDWNRIASTTRRSFCWYMTVTTSQWAAEFTRDTPLFDDLDTGLFQNLKDNVHTLMPLRRWGVPTFVTDPDYVREACANYLELHDLEWIDELKLWGHSYIVERYVNRRFSKVVWDHTQPENAESLLCHGKTGYNTVAGPTIISKTSVVVAKQLDHAKYVRRHDKPYKFVRVVEISGGNCFTYAEGKDANWINDQEYVDTCLEPLFRH
jgi:hypothetical protein